MGCGGSKHAVDTAATVKKSASKKVNEAEVEKITDNVKPEEPVVAKDDEKASVAVPEVVVAAPEDATEEKKEMKEEIPVEEEESKDVVPVLVPEGKELTPEAKKEEDVVASVAEPEVSAEAQKEEDVVVASVAETESSAAAKKEEAVVEPIAETEVSAEPKKEEAVVEAVALTQVPVKPEEEKKEEVTATESSSTETPKAE